MNYEIIDFHTHPYDDGSTNICIYQKGSGMNMADSVMYLKDMGISRICGSVICQNWPGRTDYATPWDMITDSNDRMLALRDQLGDFYVPGFHVHPDYVEQSCREIERMHNLGIDLIGELVPYAHGWRDYSCSGFDEILDTAQQYGMVVSFHSLDDDQMDDMVKKHPDLVLVAAHPNTMGYYQRHLDRMKMSKNYHLDLSGTGLFRHRMLRHGIDQCGADRFLFGTDYPVCNPAMYVGGVVMDSLLTREEKEMILAGNAKRLLKL